MVGERLTPDNTFLIQEIVDDLNTFLHLRLGLFRHGQDRPHQFARFHILQGWNGFAPKLFVIAVKTGHGNLLVESFSVLFPCFFSRSRHLNAARSRESIAYALRLSWDPHIQLFRLTFMDDLRRA